MSPAKQPTKRTTLVQPQVSFTWQQVLREMGLRLEVFLLLGIFVIPGLGGDSGCDVGYTCLSRDICVSYKSKLGELRKVETEKGKRSSEYKSILARLKSLICNQAERKVCCDRSKQPTTPTTTPTTTISATDEKSFPNFIPNIERGECGVTGDAAFIYGECKLQLFFLKAVPMYYVDCTYVCP